MHQDQRCPPKTVLRGHRICGGFTLIELLVVISIIALLIALLLPTIKKGREQGYAITCGSNLRSFQMAFVLYADDYNGILPPVFDATTDYFPGYTGTAWMTQIHDYLCGSDDVWVPEFGYRSPHHVKVSCPSVTELSYGNWNYLANKAALGWRLAPNEPFRRISEFANPSSMALLADSAVMGGDWAGGKLVHYWADYTTLHHIGLWHNDTANIVFADGHVAYATLDDEDLLDYFRSE